MDPDVDVREQEAHRGLLQWNTMTSHVGTVWNQGAPRIQAIANMRPWGDDAAGNAFHAAYTRQGGPEEMIREGGGIVEQAINLGGKVRTAVTRTRETDKERAYRTQSI
jgi:hypothetical protein